MGDITDRDRGIAELFEKLRSARGDDDARQKLLDESDLDLSDDDRLDLLEGSADENFQYDDESDADAAAQAMADEDNTDVEVEEKDTDSDGDPDEVTMTKSDSEDDTSDYGDDDDDDDVEVPEGLEDTFDDYSDDDGDSDAVQDEEPHDEDLAEEGEDNDNMIKVGARFGEHIADLSHHQ